MPEKTYNRFTNFHAGHFLQECLQRSGFSIEWLAEKTESDVAAIEVLFTQPHLDAELLVRMGIPMGEAFFSRVHEEIFGAEKSTCCHG